MTAVIGCRGAADYPAVVGAQDDVQRVAAVLGRPRDGYLKRLKANASVIAPRSGEAARQLGLFVDRVADLSTAELQELHDETFGRAGAGDAPAMASRLARHRTSATEARVALDACARILDHLDADRNPFAFVLRALCCVLLARANDMHMTRVSR